MSVTIDVAFTKQYEAEVHEAYQRMGSKLRGMCRTKTVTNAASTTFQKAGTGQAAPKSRHGLVPTMTVDHTNVEAILVDYYAGDWVDKLDELKINIDERQILSNAGAYALGRKTDDLIITELDKATNVVGTHTGHITRDLALQAVEHFNDNDVPDDGNRFFALTSRQWSAMMKIQEFVDSDYTGDRHPWLKGTENRFWQNCLWIHHSGLPRKGTATADILGWHKTAIGHAIGCEVKSDITWHGDRAAHFVNNMMSQGAIQIDDVGMVKIAVDDSAAL